MNMIDWMRATGEWMHRDRPDLYPTPHDGMMKLEEWVNTLRNLGESGSLETGGHALVYRIEEDGVEEWSVHKKISTYEVFFEEGVSNAYSWVEDSGTMIHGPDLPGVSNLEFDLDMDDDA